MTISDISRRGRWYWERFMPGSPRAAAELAVLRRGISRPAGSVPELWRFYSVVVPEASAARGLLTAELRAEHMALTLFALHQQSEHRTLMHHAATSFGGAIRRLRNDGRFSAEAVDRRMNAAATATSTTELVTHLRGLVSQLRGIHQPLDYTQLVHDVVRWDQADQRHRVRRRWGAAYYDWSRIPDDEAAQTEQIEQAVENI